MRIKLFNKVYSISPIRVTVYVILILLILALIGYIISQKSSEGFDVSYTVEPSVTDTVTSTPKVTLTPTATPVAVIYVHISGYVNNPGLICIKAGSILSDAIYSAGGLTAQADIQAINLAIRMNDGMRIHIPAIYDADKKWLIDVGYASANTRPSDTELSPQIVNINTAGIDTLITLSGVGESTARAIIRYREEAGPFSVIEDIMNVPGIGEKKFAALKDYITV